MSMYGQEGVKFNSGEGVVPKAGQNVENLNVSDIDSSHMDVDSSNPIEGAVKGGTSALYFIIGGVILFVAVVSIVSFFVVKRCRRKDDDVHTESDKSEFSSDNNKIVLDLTESNPLFPRDICFQGKD